MELGRQINIIRVCIDGPLELKWDNLCKGKSFIYRKAMSLRVSMFLLEDGLFNLISDQFEEIK